MNWAPPPPLPQASVYPPPPTKGGGNIFACRWGGPNFRRLEKSLALCAIAEIVAFSFINKYWTASNRGHPALKNGGGGGWKTAVFTYLVFCPANCSCFLRAHFYRINLRISKMGCDWGTVRVLAFNIRWAHNIVCKQTASIQIYICKYINVHCTWMSCLFRYFHTCMST